MLLTRLLTALSPHAGTDKVGGMRTREDVREPLAGGVPTAKGLPGKLDEPEPGLAR